MTIASAPWSRLRLRQSAHLRDLCAETSFTTAHLIQPIFIVEGMNGAEAIPGLDGNERLGLGPALEAIARDIERGVRHFLLAQGRRAGEDRVIDVHYADLMRNPIETMRKLYAALGDEFTPQAQASM